MRGFSFTDLLNTIGIFGAYSVESTAQKSLFSVCKLKSPGFNSDHDEIKDESNFLKPIAQLFESELHRIGYVYADYQKLKPTEKDQIRLLFAEAIFSLNKDKIKVEAVTQFVYRSPIEYKIITLDSDFIANLYDGREPKESIKQVFAPKKTSALNDGIADIFEANPLFQKDIHSDNINSKPPEIT